MSPQFDQRTHLEVGQKRTRGWYSQSVSSARFNSKCLNTRKTSTCKYPSLSFDNGTAEGLHVKNKELGRETETATHQVSQTFGPGPSNVQVDLETPRRIHSHGRRCKKSTISLNRALEGSSEDRRVYNFSVSHMSRKMPIDTGSPETHSSIGFSSPNVVNDLIPPDIDTPEMPQKASSSSKCTFLHLLLPSTPPHCHNSEILVEDTPERDYGLKVTWRERKKLMRLLIKRGQLTNQQVEIIASWYKE